jgi:hypothetical protein
MVPMEDSMDALIAELVQPLLPTKMVPKPPITQQEAVAKQVSKNRAFLLLLSSGSTKESSFSFLFALCFLSNETQ